MLYTSRSVHCFQHRYGPSFYFQLLDVFECGNGKLHFCLLTLKILTVQFQSMRSGTHFLSSGKNGRTVMAQQGGHKTPKNEDIFLGKLEKTASSYC